MEYDMQHFRHLLLFFFNQAKTPAEARQIITETYPDSALCIEAQCEFWFDRFNHGDLDVGDKDRGRKKYTDKELQEILDQNPTRMLDEIADLLNVSRRSIQNRLKSMGKAYKRGKWIQELSELDTQNRYNTCVSLLSRHKKKQFLHEIVTGEKMFIYYENPKQKKLCMDPEQPSTSTPKRNIQKKKVVLYIWWDDEGVVYYELLEPTETISADQYSHQLSKLQQALNNYRSQNREVILLHDSTKPYVTKSVNSKLFDLGWEVLPHPASSSDIAPTNYYLFQAMQHDLKNTHFQNIEEIKNRIEEWIASKDKDFFQRGIRSLPERWVLIVANEGKYNEN